MKKFSKIACLLGCCAITTGHASDQALPTVLTERGIVKFVSPTVTAQELGEMLFGAERKAKMTRSMFRNMEVTPDPLVSVAMLIQFEFDSAALTTESKSSLDTLGSMLMMEGMSDKKLVVEGHTDAIGSSTYNLDLSERRANSVRDYLVNSHGIESDRLTTNGKGENYLIDILNPKSAMNRRVQFSGG